VPAELERLVEQAEELQNQPHSPGVCPFSTGLSRVAQRAGVRIMATITDRIMAEMMVTENWR